MKDRYCMFISNCVGIHNFKFFMLFNLYSLILSLTAIACSLDYVFHFYLSRTAWDSYKYKKENVQFIDDSLLHEFFCFLVIIVAFVFFMFNSYYLVEGLQTAIQNTSRYELELKKVKGDPRLYGWRSLKYWLGRDFYFWLVPSSPALEIDYLQRTFDLDTEQKELKPMKTIYRVEEHIIYRLLGWTELFLCLSSFVFAVSLREG